jgi:hypothetical protein
MGVLSAITNSQHQLTMSLGATDHALLYLAAHPAAHLEPESADKLDHPLLKLVGANHGVLDQKATISIDSNHVVTVKTTGPGPTQSFTSSSYTSWSSAPLFSMKHETFISS